jgi:hypothetical protein
MSVSQNLSKLERHLQQEQLTDISCDISLEDMFDADKLPQFWLLVRHNCPTLSNETVNILLLLMTTYLCETEFSAAAIMNTKY